MSNLQAILKSAEESVRTVDDPDLRKIAFQEVLRHRLRSDEASPDKPRQGAAASSRGPKKGRASPAPKANSQPAIRPEVAALDLSPDERSLAPWGTLTADWKKFCWILEAARKKVEGLTNSEISHLIEKIFRERYRAEVVNNLKVQIKKGMVKSVIIESGDREYRVWKILNGGTKEVTAKPAAAE